METDYKAQRFVDLGLPSGTLWKDENEDCGLCTYLEAIKMYGKDMPTKEQYEELKEKCRWIWDDNGYKVIGPNGNWIFLPAVASLCYLWSATSEDSYNAWGLAFDSAGVYMFCDIHSYRLFVRLVQDKCWRA